jgi:hypothetical protein
MARWPPCCVTIAKRGRPIKSFWTDPDRYSLAIALALRQFGISENTAFALVATVVLGRKVAERHAPCKPGVPRPAPRITSGGETCLFFVSYGPSYNLSERASTYACKIRVS